MTPPPPVQTPARRTPARRTPVRLPARRRPAALLRSGLALLLATCTAACGRDAASPRATEAPRTVVAPPEARPARPVPPRRPAATRPTDPAPIVFDTVAPPEAPRAEAPPPPRTAPTRPLAATRPPVRPPVRPSAGPEPRTSPPRATPAAPAGSCDVRPAESYCFAYTGPAWTVEAASVNCVGAPGATFRTATCPTAGRIATCTFRRPSEPDRELVYTTYAPANGDLKSALDLARLACPGTFEAVE